MIRDSDREERELRWAYGVFFGGSSNDGGGWGETESNQRVVLFLPEFATCQCDDKYLESGSGENYSLLHRSSLPNYTLAKIGVT